VCNLATVINTATNETRFLYLRKFFLLYIGITVISSVLLAKCLIRATSIQHSCSIGPTKDVTEDHQGLKYFKGGNSREMVDSQFMLLLIYLACSLCCVLSVSEIYMPQMVMGRHVYIMPHPLKHTLLRTLSQPLLQADQI